jgi:hypothetical protein
MAKQKTAPDAYQSKPVYVEFQTSEGEKGDGKDWQAQSQKALEQAVVSLQEIARQVITGMEELPADRRPSEVTVNFGLRLDAEKGAVVAQKLEEAAFTARLVWYHREKPVATLRSTAGFIPRAPENDEDE